MPSGQLRHSRGHSAREETSNLATRRRQPAMHSARKHLRPAKNPTIGRATCSLLFYGSACSRNSPNPAGSDPKSRPREIMHPKIDSNPMGKQAVGCLGTIDVTGTRLAPNRGQTGEYARLAMLNRCKTKSSQRGVNQQASRGVHSSTCSCPL